YFVVYFFFSSIRRHTRFSRDWSSDVCSSDLVADRRRLGRTDRFQRQPQCLDLVHARLEDGAVRRRVAPYALLRQQGGVPARHQQIGRASCREREQIREKKLWTNVIRACTHRD